MDNNIDFFDKDGNKLNIDDILQIINNKVIYTPLVNRVEIIDSNGRSYTNWNDKNKTQISIQDSGKTLKIFIS